MLYYEDLGVDTVSGVENLHHIKGIWERTGSLLSSIGKSHSGYNDGELSVNLKGTLQDCHIAILDFISMVRESFVDAEKVYLNGSCVQFALILKKLYPEGIVLYDGNHAIFELHDKCFDITGCIEKGSHQELTTDNFGLNELKKILNLRYE